MILGSHNAWSYLRPTKWWMKLISFTAECQHCVLWAQYQKGVRCFDLHIRFDKQGKPLIVHGPIVYDPTSEADGIELSDYLEMLDDYKDTSVRLILDLRTKEAMKHYGFQCECFRNFCKEAEMLYPRIKFWCGRMVKGWYIVYNFDYKPSCDEMYGSVTPPKWKWALWPWLYAKLHTKEIIEKGTDKEILLVDFVDFQSS